MSDFIFVVVVWLALSFGFRRAWQRRHLQNEQSLLIWSVFLFAGGAFIFRTPQLETMMDQWFDGLPVGYWFKALFVLLAVGQYHRVLRRIHLPRKATYHWLLVLLAVALGGNTFFLLLGALQVLTSQQAHYSMMTLSDLAVLLNMSVLFLPVTIRMYQQEQLEPMRIKHIATITFCAFYAAAAAITQVAGPYTILTGEVSPLHDAIPLGMIVFICFLVQVLPHRFIHKLLYWERLYIFFKLQRLEQRVMALAGRKVQPAPAIHLINEQKLQAATYAACINILDYSPTAAQKSLSGDLLYRKIMQAAAPNVGYESLLHALARLP